jgi:hypothetical protein
MYWRRGQAINLSHLKLLFFKIFRPSKGLTNIFLGRVPKYRIIFGEILLHVETYVYQHHISDVLGPRAASRLARPLVRVCLSTKLHGVTFRRQ